jgi:hypothetical protein
MKMKRIGILPLVLVLTLALTATSDSNQDKIYWGAEVPAGWNGDWAEKFQTVPEKTDFEKTTSTYQIHEFINVLQWNSENVYVFNMFTSELRKVCPVVVLASPRITSVREAKASGKPVIYLQGSIHPPESPGKEALLMVMRDILMGDKKHLLDNQIILVCPNFNVDGTDTWSPSDGLPKLRGTRTNALGYDLNRDAIKLETNNVRELNRRVFNTWDPVLVHDTHCMGRVTHAYPIVYAASNVPTAHPEPRGYVTYELFPAVREAVKEKWGLEIYFHCGTERGKWPPTKWNHDYAAWTVEGKFIVSGYGLRNRMSILVESVWYNTYEKHIYSQYAYIHELLEYTDAHGKEMVKICQDADQDTVDQVLAKAESGELKNWVEGRYESKGKIDLLMYPEIESELIPGTSVRQIKPGVLEKGPVVVQGVEDFTKPVGIKQATMPRGYLIPADLDWLVEKLRIHSIKVDVLDKPIRVRGEEFVIDKLVKLRRGGYEMTKLEGGFFTGAEKEFPAGTFQVDMAQPVANLAFYCLEPEVGDGFVGWGLLHDYLVELGVEERSVVYPVFKYLQIVEED